MESNNKIELTEKDFEFICPVKSDDMTSIEKGYFCNKCEKNIYDVSDYSQNEFNILRMNTNDLCINFKTIVTTGLILTSSLCVASDTMKKPRNPNNFETREVNQLKPYHIPNLNQPIFIEYTKVVEMGGGAVPITIFEPDGDIFVPIETPPKQDENLTNDENSKSV